MSSDIPFRHTALFQTNKGSRAKISDAEERCECKTKERWIWNKAQGGLKIEGQRIDERSVSIQSDKENDTARLAVKMAEDGLVP